MKIFRYILAFILSFIIISIVYSLLHFTFALGIPYIDKFWVLFLYFTFGSIVWMLISFLAILINKFIFKVSKNYKANKIIFFIVCVINLVAQLYAIWSLDINYKGFILLFSIVYSYLMLNLSYYFVIGSFLNEDEL
jgi:hypothetical protein